MPKQKFLISIILTVIFVALLGGMQYVSGVEWVDVEGNDVNFTHYAKATSLWKTGTYDWSGRKNRKNF